MSKILYITSFYEQKSNSAAIRNNAWVNGLIELGNDVTVLTVEWPAQFKSRYLVSNNKAEVKRTYLKELNFLKSTTKLVNKKTSNFINKIRPIIRDVVFFPDICKGWVKKFEMPLDKDFDIIISSSDFKSSHLIGEKIKEKYPLKKWIQIWGDPWADDINLRNFIKFRARNRERYLLSKANLIVYISPLTKDVMVSRYPKIKDKTIFIPRGYYKDIIKTNKIDKNINILYTGGISGYSGRNIYPLLNSIERYNDGKRIQIKVHLYSTLTFDMKMELDKYKCVRYCDSVDYEDILDLYSHYDILLFLSNDQGSTQIPGKLFDYLGTQLPILCLLANDDNPLKDYLKKFNKCIILNNNENVITEQLSNIIDYADREFQISKDMSAIESVKILSKYLN